MLALRFFLSCLAVASNACRLAHVPGHVPVWELDSRSSASSIHAAPGTVLVQSAAVPKHATALPREEAAQVLVHSAAVPRSASAMAREAALESERIAEAAAEAKAAEPDLSVTRLRHRRSISTAQPGTDGVPSVWGVVWLVCFGDSGSTSTGHKLAVHFFCCVFAVIGLAVMCLQYCANRRASVEDKAEADWDALLCKRINDSGFEQPCCTEQWPAVSAALFGSALPQLQISGSDAELSPRTESFVSCSSTVAESEGELTPRSWRTVGDNNVFAVWSQPPTRPPSRPSSRASQAPSRPSSRAESEASRAEAKDMVPTMMLYSNLSSGVCAPQDLPKYSRQTLKRAEVVQRDWDKDVLRDWSTGSYSNFAERALTGPIIN